MKFYKCDVCGKLIDKNDPYAIISEREKMFPGLFGIVSQNKDVCPDCVEVGKLMDFKRILFETWKNEVQKERSAE